MKKLSKVLAVVLALTTLASVCCISASAEEVYDLGNGVTLEARSLDEYTPVSLLTRSVDTTFGGSVPAYPSSMLLANNLKLDNAESNLELVYSNKPSYIYISLYDITSGTYITNGTNGFIGPFTSDDVYTFRGLTGGHSYRIRMSSLGTTAYTSGTITSY